MNFESELKSTLTRHLGSDGLDSPKLFQAMRYASFSGGKRVRPKLLFASGNCLGLTPEVLLPAAISIELFHTFSLIHDDLPCLDNSDERRGKPATHKAFDEAHALLAGDALLSLSSEILLECEKHFDAQKVLRALKRFLNLGGALGVIGGQAEELSLTLKSKLAELTSVYSKKTGALFEASILIPKDFAGIKDDSREGKAFSQFAKDFGFAFQIADDLEDFKQDASRELQGQNILHYMKRDEAVLLAREALNLSSKVLFHHYYKTCEPLSDLTNQLLKKLEEGANA